MSKGGSLRKDAGFELLASMERARRVYYRFSLTRFIWPAIFGILIPYSLLQFYRYGRALSQEKYDN